MGQFGASPELPQRLLDGLRESRRVDRVSGQALASAGASKGRLGPPLLELDQLALQPLHDGQHLPLELDILQRAVETFDQVLGLAQFLGCKGGLGIDSADPRDPQHSPLWSRAQGQQPMAIGDDPVGVAELAIGAAAINLFEQAR